MTLLVPSIRVSRLDDHHTLPDEEAYYVGATHPTTGQLAPEQGCRVIAGVTWLADLAPGPSLVRGLLACRYLASALERGDLKAHSNRALREWIDGQATEYRRQRVEQLVLAARQYLGGRRLEAAGPIFYQAYDAQLESPEAWAALAWLQAKVAASTPLVLLDDKHQVVSEHLRDHLLARA